MESVYIHIPFCKSICSYCDFCKILYNAPWVTKYLNSLAKEINDMYHGEIIKTIYIGGGTPSAITGSNLKYLLDIVAKFNTSDDLEYTFECNLNDINDKLLSTLKEYKVNRLSIGIESFDEDKLQFMERNHSFLQAQDNIKLCRKYGFNNINVDLIYGIPNETLKVLKSDIDKILKLNVEHISTYSLIVEDNTKIGIRNVTPISEDIDASMFELIEEKLSSKKYIHYEVSNFSKKGFYSRHNTNYWNNDEYYGFGLGASGYINGVRYDNTRSINDYLDGKYMLNKHLLSKQEMMDNEIMLGFRKLQGINLQEFYNKYEINLQEAYDIKELLKNKELLYEDGYIFINPNYIYVMNEILIKIL